MLLLLVVDARSPLALLFGSRIGLLLRALAATQVTLLGALLLDPLEALALALERSALRIALKVDAS